MEKSLNFRRVELQYKVSDSKIGKIVEVLVSFVNNNTNILVVSGFIEMFHIVLKAIV